RLAGIETVCGHAQQTARAAGEVEYLSILDRCQPVPQRASLLRIDVRPVGVAESLVIVLASDLIVVLNHLLWRGGRRVLVGQGTVHWARKWTACDRSARTGTEPARRKGLLRQPTSINY